MKLINTLVIVLLFIGTCNATSQGFGDGGTLSGNFQIDAQTYNADSVIGAPKVDEQILSNAYLNLMYRNADFEIGFRYENYMNPLLGYDPRFQGQGIAYRYIRYNTEMLDITAGDFYEQFGSGLIFRAYEERSLGFDNAVDGVRVKFRPIEGVEFTGLLGKQRLFWNKGAGIVRGANLNIDINEMVEELLPDDLSVRLGGSLVSRFQNDNDPFLRLPENVLAYSGRLSVSSMSFMFDAEYSYKYNDPSSTNKLNYNPGQGLLLTGSVFGDGFGFSLNTHWIDNMDFRGDRTARSNELLINFIPPLTKQHGYALSAFYPYASQPNGEAGLQAEFTYKIPRNTFLGGKYGTTLDVNFSLVNSIDSTRIDKYTYDAPFLGIGDRTFFRDINFDIAHRWSEDFKTNLNIVSLIYDKDVMENEGAPKYGKVSANIIILDMTYNMNETNAIRMELQHMSSSQDSAFFEPDNVNGDWFHVLFEYTVAPNWFFTVYDQYNYGNEFEDKRIHYLNGSVAYLTGATRIQVGFGRQRGGIICVGGVCRAVPASNGLFLSLATSF
ncbi:MAG: hypothetical protein KGZ71_03460 [Desulfobulbaceae bacterium]|nr:hypothetical protein [Candidatus Kapabacteria bacterium]MBS3999521.1 hypothetical protein [Desulfobulbaceae bacterium]